jgi:hypothetical protein
LKDERSDIRVMILLCIWFGFWTLVDMVFETSFLWRIPLVILFISITIATIYFDIRYIRIRGKTQQMRNGGPGEI